MEHLRHFQLTDDPFRNEPQLRRFFASGPQQDALRRLDRAVRQGRGLSVLIGAAGAGKTMIVRRLLEELEEEVYEASMMVVLQGAADAGWMFRRFARQLGVEAPAEEREALIVQIYEQLAIIREEGRHAVLIIDDADSLCRAGALTEICGLLKLEYEDRRLLSMVLAGPPLLDEAFTAESGLTHRIDVRVYVEPFSPDSAGAYLDHRIKQVGGDPGVLENGAVNALFELGGGYPGRMNTLADNALFEAFLCGRPKLSRLDVERAHRDLGWGETPVGPAMSASAPPSQPRPGAADEADGRITSSPVTVDSVVSAEVEGPSGSGSLQATLDELDSELAAVFESAQPSEQGRRHPDAGPPKDDVDEPEDLLVELVDD